MVSLIHPISLREYVELGVEVAVNEHVDATTAVNLAAAQINELQAYAREYERARQAKTARREQARKMVKQLAAQRLARPPRAERQTTPSSKEAKRERCGTCCCWESNDGDEGECSNPSSPVHTDCLTVFADDHCTLWERKNISSRQV